MLVTTTVTLFFLLVLTGIGLLLWQKRQDDHAMPEHLITSFWVGWALLILFLQIWQIFFPVGVVSLAVAVHRSHNRILPRPVGRCWVG
jgi:hypothetical protein